MEKYVCSLELAKKLKELGVKQESEFYWCLFNGKYELRDGQLMNRPVNIYKEQISAFTAGESGDALPESIDVKGEKAFWLELGKDNNNMWYAVYRTAMEHKRLTDTHRDNRLANCLTKMLIYLIENKLIKQEG